MKMVILLFSMLVPLQEEEVRYEIRQLSADLVYLSLGDQPAPEVGSVLEVRNGDRVSAKLEVVSVSARFVSCKVLSQEDPLAMGDSVYGKPKQIKKEPEKETRVVKEPTPRRGTNQASELKRKRRLIRGSVGFSYYAFMNDANSNREFNQPALRLNIRGDNLMDGRMAFRLRTRTRYDERQSSQRDDRKDWNNRIYEASIRYGHKEDRFQYQFGRLISHAFSGVGYIDGGLVKARVGKQSEVGLFVGTQPHWQYSDLRSEIQKYGAYGTYRKGTNGKSFWESTFAVAGEYHDGTPSREFLYLRNRYSLGRRFSIYQSAEVDVNRDWREEKAGESLTLSNLYVNARWQLNKRMSAGLGYDNRTNYYTYEIRNIDEQYFDDLTRQGWRGDLSLRLDGGLRVNGGVGFREKEGEIQDTETWYVNAYHPNLFGRGWMARFRMNGFTNPYTEGAAPSFMIGRRWGQGQQASLGYAHYDYTYTLNDTERESRYLRLESHFRLGRHWYAYFNYEYNLGDEAEGQRVQCGLTYRL